MDKCYAYDMFDYKIGTRTLSPQNAKNIFSFEEMERCVLFYVATLISIEWSEITDTQINCSLIGLLLKLIITE